MKKGNYATATWILLILLGGGGGDSGDTRGNADRHYLL